jgi:hypothetical protein
MSVGNKNHQKRLLSVCKKMKCFAFVLKIKDYFYLVEIQYCYASILSERMNREIEEKESDTVKEDSEREGVLWTMYTSWII